MKITRRKVTVAEYIEQQIALCDKSQKDIAATIGYEKPNVLTMIKQGKTKLPVNKVGPLAKALGVDPVHLLRLTMAEYMPETWETIEDIVGQSLVSAGEKKLLDELRVALGGIGLEELSPKNRERLTAVLKEIATEERQDRESAVRSGTPKRAQAR